ncbi:MAG: hypothetical protein MRZ66_00235 [Clostridiales bacterium]|nr:hypothetical protein [Clostridiales bacterium]
MTTKEWLMRGWKINDTIRALEKSKVRAFELATGTTSVLKERVRESHGNGTENKFAKYSEYSKQIEIHKARLIGIMTEIETAIMQIDDNILRQLLIYRYLNFETWENISVLMNYSYVHVVHNLHPKAIHKIKVLIKFNS